MFKLLMWWLIEKSIRRSIKLKSKNMVYFIDTTTNGFKVMRCSPYVAKENSLLNSLSLFLPSLYPFLPPFLHKHITHRGRNFMCFPTPTACYVTARKSIVSSSLVLAGRCHNVCNKTWQKEWKAQKKKKKLLHRIM